MRREPKLEVSFRFFPLDPWKTQQKICRSQRGWRKPEDDPLNQPSRAHGDSQRLKQKAQTLQGPLHVCYSCEPHAFCGTPKLERVCL